LRNSHTNEAFKSGHGRRRIDETWRPGDLETDATRPVRSAKDQILTWESREKLHRPQTTTTTRRNNANSTDDGQTSNDVVPVAWSRLAADTKIQYLCVGTGRTNARFCWIGWLWDLAPIWSLAAGATVCHSASCGWARDTG